MENDPFIEIAKENYISGLNLLKEYEPGSAEFDLGFQLIVAYKIFMDRKSGRIIKQIDKGDI